MQKIVAILVLISSIYTAHALNYQQLAVGLHIYNTVTMQRSHVTFLKNSDENAFVIKQYKSKNKVSKSKVFLPTTLCELVALDMAQALGVSHDTACLIPAGVPFIGKQINLPASLHNHVPGIKFTHYKGTTYKRLTLVQTKSEGLTKKVIHHMSRHKDLPPLAALDTFVGNNDRGPYNFFYHQTTDSFTGIDMGHALSHNLCSPSVKSMQTLLNDNTTIFSKQEKAALKIYYQTLKKLVELFPPDRVIDKLDTYAQNSGLFDAHFFTAKEQKIWKRFFKRCKSTIRANYPEAKALIQVLEQLLIKHGC